MPEGPFCQIRAQMFAIIQSSKLVAVETGLSILSLSTKDRFPHDLSWSGAGLAHILVIKIINQLFY